MTGVAAIALVLWTGGRAIPVAAAFAAMHLPVLAFFAVVALVIRQRLDSDRTGPEEEARFLRAFAAELHGGASPRAAILRSATRHPRLDLSGVVRSVTLGLSLDATASQLERSLPVNGGSAAAALVVGGRSGAPLAGVMDVLAARSMERSRLWREQRALTAQTRASAWLIASIPAGLIVYLALSGHLEEPGVAPVVVVGAVLQLVGLILVASIVRGRR